MLNSILARHVRYFMITCHATCTVTNNVRDCNRQPPVFQVDANWFDLRVCKYVGLPPIRLYYKCVAGRQYCRVNIDCFQVS